MSSEQEGPFVPAGIPVEDVDGVRIGVVRAVYPHYIAVGEHSDHPAAYRVPLRAIADIDDIRIRLTIPQDVLDPMTAEELTAFGLPEHGGEIVLGSPLAEAQTEAEESLGVTEQPD
jgi:hypothetical protein